jgi:hypothetical protein
VKLSVRTAANIGTQAAELGKLQQKLQMSSGYSDKYLFKAQVFPSKS